MPPAYVPPAVTTGDSLTVDLDEITASVAETLGEQYPEATIETDTDGPLRVEGTESLGIAISNLVDNAVEHAEYPLPTVRIGLDPDGKPPRTVASDSVESGEWVEDDGPGIPDHEREVVTGAAEETQLTHKSGVGLWLVDYIVTSLSGDGRIEDNDPQGTVVTPCLREE